MNNPRPFTQITAHCLGLLSKNRYLGYICMFLDLITPIFPFGFPLLALAVTSDGKGIITVTFSGKVIYRRLLTGSKIRIKGWRPILWVRFVIQLFLGIAGLKISVIPGMISLYISQFTGMFEIAAIASNGKRMITQPLCGKYPRLFDIENGRKLFSLRHSNTVAIAIADDGTQAISASSDGTIKIWDLNLGIEKHTFSDQAKGVAISKNGMIGISFFQTTLKVWDLVNMKSITEYIGDRNFTHCAITADAITVIAGDALGTLHFLKLKDYRRPCPPINL